jgi:hypothetical protein
MVSKLWKIWSGLFIPDPGSVCWLSTHRGSRIQGSKRHRIPDPDRQHWIGHKTSVHSLDHKIRIQLSTMMRKLSDQILLCSLIIRYKYPVRRYLPAAWAIAIYAPTIYTAPCVLLLMRAAAITYEGKWEGVGPWKSRLFGALWNGTEPIGECHLGPK